MKKTLSIVLICGLLITMGGVSVFADNLPEGNRYIGDWNSYNRGDTSSTNTQVKIFYYVTWYDPYISNVAESMNQQNMALGRDVTYCQDYTINIIFRNNTNSIQIINATYLSFRLTLANYSDSTAFSDAYDGFILKDHSSNITPTITHQNTLSTINMNLSQEWFSSNVTQITLPPHCARLVELTYTRTNTVYQGQTTLMQNNLSKFSRAINNVQMLTPSLTNSKFETYINNDAKPYDTIYNTYEINHGVQSILDAYTEQYNLTQDLNNGTQTNQQTLSNIGTNEDTWFTQNNQALQATGITNFNYTPTIMSGMSVISDQFNRLWLAIGDWNFVYTFSMMLGLVVLILRHNPQRKKSSSSSGSGGGKSNAASS